VEVRPDPGVVFFGHPSPNISGTLCPGTVHFAIEFNRPWAIRHSGHFNTDTGLYDT